MVKKQRSLKPGRSFTAPWSRYLLGNELNRSSNTRLARGGTQTCSGWAAKAFIRLTGGTRHTMPARTREADGSYHLPRLAEASVSLFSADTGTLAIRVIQTFTTSIFLQVWVSFIGHSSQEPSVWDKETSHRLK